MELLKKVFTSEIKGIDEKEGTLTAFVSTATRDRSDEVLAPSGADLKNYAKNPVVLWAHDYSRPPIGKAMWTKRTSEGILSKVKFASTAFAQEIFQLYKEGFLRAFSVGFMPKQFEDGDGKKSPRRTYTNWEMLEYSAVPVPANPDALGLAIQKGILKTEEIKKAMEPIVEEELLQGEEVEVKEVKEEVKEVEKKDGLDELLAENELLRKENERSKNENAELRYKIYTLIQSYEAKKPKSPEMTVDEIGKLIAEGVDGVIRKHQGKVS